MKKVLFTIAIAVSMSFVCSGYSETNAPIKDQKETFVHATNFP
jgi:hypothetical protein